MKPKIFKPMFIEKLWGGRALKRLFNKPLPPGKSIGESWELWKRRFPIVVKLIDVKKALSIQVHPSGKSELWYVIEAGRESKVLGGVTLQEYKINKGTWIYIPSGTVHTIFPPAVLLEVSQNKLITYRLYDWGRKRGPLEINKGLKALNPKAKLQVYRNINSFRCPYFKVELIELKKERIRNRTPYVYFVLEGKGFIRRSTPARVQSVRRAGLSVGGKVDKILFKRGDTILVPGNCNIEVLSPLKLFRISP